MEPEAPATDFPWANGTVAIIPVPPCRRPAVRALGCWVRCDHQRPTLWPEHHHDHQVQVLLAFDRTDCVARWHPVRSRRMAEAPVRAGQVWILPPGVRHEVEWRRQADMVTLHIESRWARESAGREITDISFEPLDRYVRNAPIIGELCGLLRHQGRTHGPFNVPIVSGLGSALAVQLMAAHFPRPHAGHPHQWVLPRPVLADVCAHIDTHLAEKLTLPGLARLTGLSPSYFGQIFRAALGMSPISYILDQRVLRARELLRRGHSTVAEVAHAVGFSDQHQMNRHFRRLLHTPPSAYRPPKE